VNEQGNPISIDYSLYRRDGSWKAYDVVVQGSSLARNYRGQFDMITENGDSFNVLLAVLRQRAARMCRLSGTC